MSQRLMLPVLAAVLAGAGCYQDDTVAAPLGKPLAKVLLTDAPFPYESVASVNVYVVRIEASANADTSGAGDWVAVTEPGRGFNLLELDQGTTAFVGEGELPAGQYHTIRMTIDTNRSSIVWSNGLEARVDWRNNSGSDEMPLYAYVASPVDVPTEGAEIVIDFDVGQSFLYDYYGAQEFTFTPRLRAISSAATGAIRGAVTSDYTGETRPVENAAITVYADACTASAREPPEPWCVVATGRSDSAGHYTVAFVPAGTYNVLIEQPSSPFLDPVVTPNVQVTAGATTTVLVSLPEAGSGGGAYIHISGPNQVGVGGTITLYAAVGDENGDPVPNPSVTWTCTDTTRATVAGESDTATVTGRRAGFTTIVATSGGLTDTLWIEVKGSTSSAPVARVSVVPGSADLGVGDTAVFRAEPRDSAGTVLPDRPVSWFGTDSLVFVIEQANGSQATIRARGAGSAFLRATSEGKTGQATITVQ